MSLWVYRWKIAHLVCFMKFVVKLEVWEVSGSWENSKLSKNRHVDNFFVLFVKNIVFITKLCVKVILNSNNLPEWCCVQILKFLKKSCGIRSTLAIIGKHRGAFLWVKLPHKRMVLDSSTMLCLIKGVYSGKIK